MGLRICLAGQFGDIFMRCVYRMRPYEKVPGSVNAMHEKWLKIVTEYITAKKVNLAKFPSLCKQIIKDFDNIEILDIKKPRVGIVGEILVKFSPAGNNYLVDLLEAEGAEAVVPELVGFIQYCFYNQIYKAENLGTSKNPHITVSLAFGLSNTFYRALQRKLSERANILLLLPLFMMW